MLAELSAALGHETGIESAPDALAALAEAVPFYAGITDDEIGGRGIRWQDRPAADTLPRGAPPREVPDLDSVASARSVQNSPGEGIDGRLLLGTYRDLWAGPITELNPALRFLKPGQTRRVVPGGCGAAWVERMATTCLLEVIAAGSKLGWRSGSGCGMARVS